MERPVMSGMKKKWHENGDQEIRAAECGKRTTAGAGKRVKLGKFERGFYGQPAIRTISPTPIFCF
jgi:hypothetical protein